MTDFFANSRGQIITRELYDAEVQCRYRRKMRERFESLAVSLPTVPMKTWTPPRGGSAAVAAIGGAS